ncbi:MAG: YlcI/YnfO family protein [Thermoleophilaceae bacterium]
MRTTIRLDDELLAEAKQAAARSGRTLTAVIEDALRVSLSRMAHSPRAEPVDLPVSRLRGGLQPGVDLDDSAALLDLMEEDDPPY